MKACKVTVLATFLDFPNSYSTEHLQTSEKLLLYFMKFMEVYMASLDLLENFL